MESKCFGLCPITRAVSGQSNAADEDSPDAAPVVPMASHKRVEIKKWWIENWCSDMEVCKQKVVELC